MTILNLDAIVSAVVTALSAIDISPDTLTVHDDPPAQIRGPFPEAIVYAMAGGQQYASLGGARDETATVVVIVFLADKIGPAVWLASRAWTQRVTDALFAAADDDSALGGTIRNVANVTWQIGEVEYASQIPPFGVRFELNVEG